MEAIKNAISDYHNQTRQLIDPLKEQVKNLDGKLESALTEIAQKMEVGHTTQNRAAAVAEPGRFFVNVAGNRLPVLRNCERLSGHFNTAKGDFDLADYVRHNMGHKVQNAVVTSGPATVPTGVAAGVIDAVRAQSRIIEAGAGTIFIDGPSNIARIDGDPTFYEHTEGTEDIQDSVCTLSAVALDPKLLVAAIPLSEEIVADSPNLNDILTQAVAQAFGAKLDALAIAVLLADANIPVASTVDTATWAGIMSLVNGALAANQDLPSALICNTADFTARASQLASTSGSWLGAPPVLANMKDLFTTKLSAGEAILGDFYRALLIAVRSELRLEMVRWNQYKSGSHVLICHARAAGIVAQPGRLIMSA